MSAKKSASVTSTKKRRRSSSRKRTSNNHRRHHHKKNTHTLTSLASLADHSASAKNSSAALPASTVTSHRGDGDVIDDGFIDEEEVVKTAEAIEKLTEDCDDDEDELSAIDEAEEDDDVTTT